MSNEISEMNEFNSLVESSGGKKMSSSSFRGEIDAPVAEDNSPSKAKDAKMWAVNGDNYFPCDESVKQLTPGQYEIGITQQGPYFQRKLSNFDELFQLPDSASREIYDNIETFWQKEEHFRSFGFLWKRGILLWGPPGSGKTSTLQLLSKQIVDRGGISVYVSNPKVAAAGLHVFRRLEPKRPCIVMLEDIDAMISSHGETEVLALLDGELQIDNVVFVATTNYPERLDRRLVNRPSRFDIIKLINMPNEEARRAYLLRKNKRLEDALLDCTKCETTGKVSSKCPNCKGEKLVPGVKEVVCEDCNGDGAVPFMELEGAETSEPCAPCSGAGKIAQECKITCQQCEGSGQIPVECTTCNGSGNVPEIDKWIEHTENFSLAHIKELIVSVEVFEVEFDYAVKRLNAMIGQRPKSTDATEQTHGAKGNYN